MTDDEIKAVVAKYIISGHESDNADCLHERDEFYNDTGDDPDEILKRAYVFYRSANVSVTWPGEGGASEPRGDSPDSPPAGKTGLPGGSDDYVSAENHPDDSAGIEHVIPLTKNSGIPSKGILVYDMVLPKWHGVPKDYWTPFRNAPAGSGTDEGSTN